MRSPCSTLTAVAAVLVASSSTSSTTTTAFVPTTTTRTRANTAALHVSVVREFLSKEEAETKILQAFETQSPESVGIAPSRKDAAANASDVRRKSRRGRKHNYSKNQEFLREKPDLDFYTLHSSAVSHLERDMPIDDIIRAIKRAQNLHDAHDLATISAFLIHECDEHWGYGFRGALLSRLAVAALHCGQVQIAQEAIATRRVFERPSMKPHESAAIIRGLMRNGLLQEGWDVLNDELRLPLDGTPLDDAEARDVIKHRALALASIASRFFYQGQPHVSATALEHLTQLGVHVEASHLMRDRELPLPWARLVAAAAACSEHVKNGTADLLTMSEGAAKLPEDLAELVWNTMSEFPCPGEAEECGIEDYLMEDL